MVNWELDLVNAISEAEQRYKEYNSPHEGFAIILEEVDELKEEVWKKHHDEWRMYKEATHIAVTAVRFMKMMERKIKGA